jgi:hypothetical protein
VAVIGSDRGPHAPAGRIVVDVDVDGTGDSAHVLNVASGEAELRGAALTILDPALPTRNSANTVGDQRTDPIQLLITGQQGNTARDVTCSVLICP